MVSGGGAVFGINFRDLMGHLGAATLRENPIPLWWDKLDGRQYHIRGGIVPLAPLQERFEPHLVDGLLMSE